MVGIRAPYLIEDADTVEGVLCLDFRAVKRVHGRFRRLELLKVGARASGLRDISWDTCAGV